MARGPAAPGLPTASQPQPQLRGRSFRGGVLSRLLPRPQGALSTDSQVQPEGFFSHSATLRMSFPRKLWFWDGLLISRGDKCHDGYGDQEE